MQPIIDALAEDPSLLLGLVLGSLGMLAAVLIVWMATSAAVRNAQEREQSRREVAAYVAEGSMSSDDAERILQPKPWYASANWFGSSKNGKG